jgi:hypothetical protein
VVPKKTSKYISLEVKDTVQNPIIWNQRKRKVGIGPENHVKSCKHIGKHPIFENMHGPQY